MRSSAGTNRQYHQSIHLLHPEENQEFCQGIYLSEETRRLKNQNVVNQNHFLLILLGLLAFVFRGIANETHWSLVPPEPPSAGKSIDEFIEKKLSEKGLKQSGEASRRILIRRLYLVMHGLPPTPDQVEAFLDDQRENAWKLLVDQVLKSPRYGERWASHWLDLARFGETHGYEMNRERPNAWLYRDWVIDSLNADKPYNRFVREQIAGDALGEPTGTGFLVAGPVDQVKGNPDLRAMQRMNELDDMINTMGTAFLGLTTGCARCHDHKFDPITQTDYYAMQAVFAGVKHSDSTLPLTPAIKKKIEEIEEEVNTLSNKLEKFIPNEANSSRTAKRPAVSAKFNVETFKPHRAKFIRFMILKTNGNQPCIDELEIFSQGKNLALAANGAKATSNGDFKHPLHKLEHINDGKYGNPRSWISVLHSKGWVQIELPEEASIDRIEWARDRAGKYNDRLAVEYRIESSLKKDDWELLADSQDRLPFKNNEKKAKPTYDFSAFPEEEAKQGKQWLARLDEANNERKRFQGSVKVYAGTFSQPGPTHRLYRGEHNQKREEVGPDAIAALASLGLENKAPERERRTSLANWIASKENPLTARVMVNRIWQFHFGKGIVDTPSDFGSNGVPPTHPQLLDWLAIEFMEGDWSLKKLHKLILLSKTWRQSSQTNLKAMQVDASSQLLWRFPPRRLEAEAIRDSILAASGTLDLRMGGPGFSAFQVQAENVRHYFPKKEYGPADWRRMIYMTKVRQEQESVFGAFDCPDASQSVPKRSRSTTPLQALNLLNSRFVMQQADFLVKRLEKEEGQNLSSQVARAWQLCFNRPTESDELRDSLTFIKAEGRQQFARALLNANEFIFIP